MRSRLADERGFTLIELLIVVLIVGFVMEGVMNLLVSGTRAQADTQARIEAQQNAGLAITRLDYEARCASGYTLLGSGTGISLTLPSYCSHATGTVTWCVSSGALWRYTSSSCGGSGGQSFVDSVTSSAPFSVVTANGDLPRLEVQLSIDATDRASDAFALDDTVTFRNAARTSS